MNRVSDLLRAADPLRHEPLPDEAQRGRLRRTIVGAASNATGAASPWVRRPVALLAVAALVVSVLVALGSRTGPRGSTTVFAAVRFEVRLAEEQPAAGLQEARVSGSGRTIYLHEEVVVTNADIERCALIPDKDRPRFDVGVQFTAAGGEKMRKATEAHMGKPMAVLIDGEVVMAPVVRSPITTSAVISGNYSRAEAERIVNGIGVR